mgnify:CR=1 FL=1|tara:strand:+ start:334 stop:795 length:462 start_codon:yes stop_codon:yes gene_type:complete
MILKEHVVKVQNQWGEGVVKIGELKNSRLDCESYTNEFLDRLYSFESGPVLFKPTKCEEIQFRPIKAAAKSYFIAGENRACNEDKGFAIHPWTKVRFENSNFILDDHRAIAMGNYFFTDNSGEEVKVEYTFGYKLIDGNLKIDVHHSSFPFHN